MRLFFLAAIVALICVGVSPSQAQATVFRDRTSFNAASQNLRLIDFESAQLIDSVPLQIDGVLFRPFNGADLRMGPNGTKTLFVRTVGEITRIIIDLPPGTTAVACDQFATPMIVTISTGSTSESVTMNPGDSSTFAGFVSDEPIRTLTIELDFPEPTPDAVIDNVSFGQRRAGNEPPLPFLLVTNDTGRAVALDSVTKQNEPFRVPSIYNMSSDGRTRLTLFVVGLVLSPSDVPFVTVQAENAQQQVFNLPVEVDGTNGVKNIGWMSQVTVRLPDTVAGAGELKVSVTVRGVTSNKAPLRID